MSAGLLGAARPVVVEICWHCSGTGRRLVSTAPFKFQVCPICYGRRGRVAARHEFAPAARDRLIDLVCTLAGVFDKNLNEAHREYMAGDIPAGAFRYVRDRHQTVQIIKRDGERFKDGGIPITDDDLFRAVAPLTIDLRDAIKSGHADPKCVKIWWELFKEAGYTDSHRVYNIPMRPECSSI